MSFSADVEHIWTAPEQLPETVRGVFKDGAAVVFATDVDGKSEPQLVAAIPATNDQTETLSDLMEIAAIALTGDDVAYRAYCKLRDELSAPLGYQRCTILFQQEMKKAQSRDEKYHKLASAARNN